MEKRGTNSDNSTGRVTATAGDDMETFDEGGWANLGPVVSSQFPMVLHGVCQPCG
jgi:hypothetical protein